MHENDTVPKYLSVRFADGHRMWLATDSPTEVVLHPAFLKYLAICLLLIAMLDRGGIDVGLIHGQQIAFLWLVLGAQALLWYGTAFHLVGYLARRGKISSIFTPIIVMPNLIVIHICTNQVVQFLGNNQPPNFDAMVTGIIRDVVVLLVIDVMFSNYVVHQHPAFSKTPVDLNRAKSPPAVDLPLPPTIETSPPQPVIASPTLAEDALVPDSPATMSRKPLIGEIQIGGKSFNPADIIALRSEDHYVAVYMANQRHLVRARLSEAVDKLDIRLGLRVNRSAWVAFAAISRLSNTDGSMKVIMHTGREESVAVVRRHAIRLAFENYRQSSVQKST